MDYEQCAAQCGNFMVEQSNTMLYFLICLICLSLIAAIVYVFMYTYTDDGCEQSDKYKIAMEEADTKCKKSVSDTNTACSNRYSGYLSKDQCDTQYVGYKILGDSLSDNKAGFMYRKTNGDIYYVSLKDKKQYHITTVEIVNALQAKGIKLIFNVPDINQFVLDESVSITSPESINTL